MRVIKVKSAKRSYDIVVGKNAIRLLGKYIKKLNLGKNAYIITNPLVKDKCSQALIKELKKSGFNFKDRVLKSKAITIPNTAANKDDSI